MSVVDDRPGASAAPVRRVIRGAGAVRADEHAFAVVADLPTITLSRPPVTGDGHIDSLRAAAWDEGLALGREQGRADGYAEGHELGRREGRAAGHAEGLAAGRAQASEELAAVVGSALAALEAATSELERRNALSLADIERSVVDLAVGLAAAILEREVASVDEVGLDAVRRALHLAPERGELVVRVNPDDLAVVSGAAPLAPGRAVELVGDPAIVRGGCLVENDATRVDGRIDVALLRARAALLDADPDAVGSTGVER